MPGDMRAFNRAIVEEFRANNGKVDNEMLRDARLVLLTTTGVESGRAHTVPLGDFSEDAGRVVLWASAMGAPKHPAWYRNLAANPRVVVERPDEDGAVRRVEATAVTATGADRERLFAALKSASPAVAAHQDRTDREIPLVVIDC
ncbi:nitroreductase/quinone reductase family protein [Amycolatopsis sp. CA-230715]|uniref:nitroreductase/quinone reductase family protein n=1 Tax=Amycolatopsis sp. CA-230715 TaxID=2745196 RepID=UPI001C32E21B|nr:nitroreductase/quinone reductase family protein [Amycolatopsis sp. CA-230715]QWF76728.1 Deazaflavin-dependent nitroreductase [Amycolatopsis sp. CA-230715]